MTLVKWLAAIVLIVIVVAALAMFHVLPKPAAEPINRQLSRLRIPTVMGPSAESQGVDFELLGGKANVGVEEHGTQIATLSSRSPRAHVDATPGMHTYRLRIGGKERSVLVDVKADSVKRVTIETNHLRVKPGEKGLQSYRDAVVKVSE